MVACPLQSVGLDGGYVNGQGPVAGSRPGLPRPGQQLELTDERKHGALTVPPRVQAVHIGVVNAVAPSQRRPPASPAFARPGASRCWTFKAEMPGQGGRKERPALATSAVR